MKQRIYIDLDGVCADFDKAFTLSCVVTDIDRNEDIVPEGFFLNIEPVEGAIEAVHTLASMGYDLYFLSTPQWSNPNCWKEKRLWVEKHYGDLMFKRLILTHNKGLLIGDYLIDDRIKNGVENFCGTHLHFGSEQFPTWKEVLEFFEHQILIQDIKRDTINISSIML